MVHHPAHGPHEASAGARCMIDIAAKTMIFMSFFIFTPIEPQTQLTHQPPMRRP